MIRAAGIVAPGPVPLNIANRRIVNVGISSAQDRQAEYCPQTNCTYFAFLGMEREAYIQSYNHATGVMSDPVFVAAYGLADTDDDHGVPSITVTDNGTIWLMFGVHGISPIIAKSTNPYDISAWTAVVTTDIAGTYHTLASDGNTLLTFFRGGGGHNGAGGTAPLSHEFGLLASSTDGVTWTTLGYFDLRLYTGSASEDCYPMGLDVSLGRYYVLFHVAAGATHGTSIRQDVLAGYWDPAQATFCTILGTAVAAQPASQANLQQFRLATITETGGLRQDFEASGQPVYAWMQVNSTNWEVWFGRMVGGVFTTSNTGIQLRHIWDLPQVRVAQSGEYQIFSAQRDDYSDAIVTGVTANTAGSSKVSHSFCGGAAVRARSTTGLTGSWTIDVLARRDRIAAQGASCWTVPRFSKDKFAALMVPGAPEGGATGGLDTATLPLYFVTDVTDLRYVAPATPGRYAFYIDQTNAYTTFVDQTPTFSTAWQTNAALAALIPLCATEVLLEVYATNNGTLGRYLCALSGRPRTSTQSGQITASFEFPAANAVSFANDLWVPIQNRSRAIYWQHNTVTSISRVRIQLLGYACGS